MTKLLLVDDENSSRLAIEEYLGACGFDIRSVADGEAAVAIGLEMAPNVLICDWLLPGGVSGLDVVRALLDAFPRLVVLIVTGLPVATVAREAQGLAIVDILSKPVGLSALERAIREAEAK